MIKVKNIFLVEDDEDDQEFFKEAINDIDNTICLDMAVNGLDAIGKLAHMSILPDLIFMDINMPLMNGLECLKKLKSMAQFKNIPVVILSTSVNFNESQRADALGAGCFFSKPSDAAILKKNIMDMFKIYIPASAMGFAVD